MLRKIIAITIIFSFLLFPAGVKAATYTTEIHPINVIAGEIEKFIDDKGYEQERISRQAVIEDKSVFGYYQTTKDGKMLLFECNPVTKQETGKAYFYNPDNPLGYELDTETTKIYTESYNWENPLPIYAPKVKIWMPANGVTWEPGNSLSQPRGGCYLPEQSPVVATITNLNDFGVRAHISIPSLLDRDIELSPKEEQDFFLTNDATSLNKKFCIFALDNGNVVSEPGYSEISYSCTLTGIEFPTKYPQDFLHSGGFYQNIWDYPVRHNNYDPKVFKQDKLRWIIYGDYRIFNEGKYCKTEAGYEPYQNGGETWYRRWGWACAPVGETHGNWAAMYNFETKQWEIINHFFPLFFATQHTAYHHFGNYHHRFGNILQAGNLTGDEWQNLYIRVTENLNKMIYDQLVGYLIPERHGYTRKYDSNKRKDILVGPPSFEEFLQNPNELINLAKADIEENIIKRLPAGPQSTLFSEAYWNTASNPRLNCNASGSDALLNLGSLIDDKADLQAFINYGRQSLGPVEKELAFWVYTPDWQKAGSWGNLIAPAMTFSQTGAIRGSRGSQLGFSVVPINDICFKLVGSGWFKDIELIACPKMNAGNSYMVQRNEDRAELTERTTPGVAYYIY